MIAAPRKALDASKFSLGALAFPLVDLSADGHRGHLARDGLALWKSWANRNVCSKAQTAKRFRRLQSNDLPKGDALHVDPSDWGQRLRGPIRLN